MQSTPLPKLVAIVGPTAGGKTSLAIALAKTFGGEIVSADSRQVYRGMDIGTAKPTAAERAAVPHHLLDIKDPGEEYTVAEYQQDAVAAVQGILGRGHVPFLVGGTGLYVRAVVENLDIPKAKADPQLRARIEREIAEEGLAAVFEKLLACDPEAANVVDPKNPRRVIRALEVAISTGEPFTAQRKKAEHLFDVLEIGLNPPPEILRERIELRVDRMAENGLVEEVKALVQKYGSNSVALDTIGYREIIGYLEGNLSRDAAIALMKANTLHYAKRQLTWFRKDKNVRWIDRPEDAFPPVKRFLQI